MARIWEKINVYIFVVNTKEKEHLVDLGEMDDNI